MAWGDIFFSIPGQQPFATIVKSDYAGVDESSQLDRDEAFRVNIGIGREAMRAASRATTRSTIRLRSIGSFGTPCTQRMLMDIRMDTRG